MAGALMYHPKVTATSSYQVPFRPTHLVVGPFYSRLRVCRQQLGATGMRARGFVATAATVMGIRT